MHVVSYKEIKVINHNRDIVRLIVFNFITIVYMLVHVAYCHGKMRDVVGDIKGWIRIKCS